MKILRTFLVVAFVVMAITGTTAHGQTVFAQTPTQVETGVDAIRTGSTPPLENTVKNLVSVFLFVIGAVSVLMLVYGGFRYVTSAGEAQAVTAAKNTILYAIIGIAVAMLAYAIADFVIDIFVSPETPPARQAPRGVGPTPD